jgi:hypothetical protein
MIVLAPYAITRTADPIVRFSQATLAATCPPEHDLWWLPCGPDTQYEDAIRALWRGRLPFAVVEHDVTVPPAVWAHWAVCDAPVCAAAYWLAVDPDHRAAFQRYWHQVQAAVNYPAVAGAPAVQRLAYLATVGGFWAHRYVAPTGIETPGMWGSAWADWVGFGATRFRPDRLPTWPDRWAPGPWSDLDTRVSTWLHRHGVRMHILWPAVPHHHGCPCHAGLRTVTHSQAASQ